MKKRTGLRMLTSITALTLVMALSACSGEASGTAADAASNTTEDSAATADKGQTADTLVSAGEIAGEMYTKLQELKEMADAAELVQAAKNNGGIGIEIVETIRDAAEAETMRAENMESASGPVSADASEAGTDASGAGTAATVPAGSQPADESKMLTASDLDSLESLLAKRFDCDMSDEQMGSLLGSPLLTVAAFDDLVRYKEWNHLIIIESLDRTRAFLYLTTYMRPYGPCLWEVASKEEAQELVDGASQLLDPAVEADWSVHELLPGTEIDQAYIDWFCETEGNGLPVATFNLKSTGKWYRATASWAGGGMVEISEEEARAGAEYAIGGVNGEGF